MELIRITPDTNADLYILLYMLAVNMIPFEYIYDITHNIYINGHCDAARQIIKEHAIDCEIFLI